MQISSKGRYALTIMVSLAKNYPNDTFLTLKNIAEANNLSIKYLEKIIATLNKNDYLEVLRGNSGGYKLKHEPSYYKIGDILKVAEGDLTPVTCLGNHEECKIKDKCTVYPFWEGLYSEINDYVNSKTLEDYI